MLLHTFTDSSTHFRASVAEANRALLAAAGLPTSASSDEQSSAITPAADLPGWDVTTDSSHDDRLTIGDTVQFAKTISDTDVRQFAAGSGDTNPLHLDEEAASETRFGDRIVHGLLVSGLISAALARFPGQIVYLSQDLAFHGPVYVGDRVSAACTIVESLGEDRYRLSTTVSNDETTVIDGEAVVLVEGAAEAR
ncbi:MAG: MaoC family dehydratase [Halorientalis sp.]